MSKPKTEIQILREEIDKLKKDRDVMQRVIATMDRRVKEQYMIAKRAQEQARSLTEQVKVIKTKQDKI